MASKQTQKTQQHQQQPQAQAQVSKQKAAEAEAEKIKEYIAKQVLRFPLILHLQMFAYRTSFSIHYSDRYSDEEYEYRHVILPKPLFKMIPKAYFNPDDPGVLRLLSEAEWRGIGITQSLGWEHYEVHGMLAASPFFIHLSDSTAMHSIAPEPHVLLFRRAKNADLHQAVQEAPEMQIKAAGAAKNGRKK